LGVLLVETASTEEEFNTVQFHLNKAKSDPVMSPTVYYGAGSLALRRQQPDAALVALRKAREMAPDSDPIRYALAQAERLNGNAKEAEKLLREYQNNQKEKQAEVDLLKRIADNPDQPGLYQDAIAFYEKRGRSAQVAAIRQEMRRRFKAVN
jgi:Tfp pilus assembly protein PilF